MSEGRFVVVHYNGIWNGNFYAQGDTRAFEIIGDSLNLSTLRRFVSGIVGGNSSVDKFEICEIVEVNGKAVMLTIQNDIAVEALFRRSHSPDIYVCCLNTIQSKVDWMNNGTTGKGDEHCSFTKEPMGFMSLLESFNSLNGGSGFTNHSKNVFNLDGNNCNVEENLNVVIDNHTDSSDSSYDYSSNDSLDESSVYSTDDASNEGEHDIQLDDDVCTSSFSNPGSVNVSSPERIVDAQVVDAPPGVLNENTTFTSKDEVYELIGEYHILNKVTYRVKKSDPSRLQLRCKFEDCDFLFHVVGKKRMWRTVKFTAHTCSKDPDCSSPLSFPSKALGSFYAKQQIDLSSKFTPISLMEDLKKNHGVMLLYNQAVRSKKRCDDIIYGDFDKSFSLLPSYLYQLREANPGTFVHLEVDDDRRFKNVFYALAACISGFKKHARPVVVVDGTHLKGKYKGIIFVAVTQDCNHNIFPLATGIGHKEDNESWVWFFTCLKEAFKFTEDDLLIVSDQHKSIIHAKEKVFPNAAHGLCYVHLLKKVVRYGKAVTSFFKKAAYTYREYEFNSVMQSIADGGSSKLMKTLANAKRERWSRVHCPVRRYEFMTSNAAESWNKRLLFARDKPIVYVLEYVRSTIEKWFHSRLADAKSNPGKLCSLVSSELLTRISWGDKLTVHQLLGNHLYKVSHDTNSYVVDLVSRKCECFVFQKEGVPCSHAVAAIRYSKFDVSKFVDDCYSSVNLIGMWSGTVMPLVQKKFWVLPEQLRSYNCLPPLCPRQAGRPKKSRKRSAIESISSNRKVQKCSRCRSRDHNRVNCTVQVQLGHTVEVRNEDCDEEESVGIKGSGLKHRVRRPRRCSICRRTGHTKRKCPY